MDVADAAFALGPDDARERFRHPARDLSNSARGIHTHPRTSLSKEESSASPSLERLALSTQLQLLSAVLSSRERVRIESLAREKKKKKK